MADAEAVPEGQKAGWLAFVKQLTSATGDLSSMTAPSFILSPTSLVEFSAYWGEPHHDFAAIATGNTPEQRMLLVVRYFITTLKGQYTKRETTTGSEKKPLNPVLGELFFGKWEGPRGELVLISEQVSHHPPITAYFLENKQAGVSLEGNCAQKTSFSGKNINVKQVGHAILRVALPDGSTESYLFSLPRLRIEGIFFGSPYVELADSSHIQSSTGYHATIEYSGKGYFSGKSHSFKCKIGPSSSASATLPTYIIDGQWTGKSQFHKDSRQRAGQPFVDAGPDTGRRDEISVAPIEEQGEMESRRVWQAVADGIRRGDFEKSSTAKGKLENEQRQKRKDEQASGQPWQLQYFTHVADDAEYAKLASLSRHEPAKEGSYVYNKSPPPPRST